MGDDRPSTYEEDGKIIYRASSAGNCIRGLVASRLGYTPVSHPDWLLDKFAQGVKQEPIMLGELRYRGWAEVEVEELSHYGTITSDGQVETHLQIGENIYIRCHPDGIAYCFALQVGDKFTLGERRVVEVKAFTQNMLNIYNSKGIEAFPYYAMQLSLEMATTGLPGLLVIGLKDKDNPDADCEEFFFHFYDTPPIPTGLIKAKIGKVESWVARGELPSCDWAQYPCQFYFLHEDDSTAPEVKTIPNKDKRSLFDNYAKKYEEAVYAEGEAKRKKQEAKIYLMEAIDDAKAWGEYLAGDEYVVQDVQYEREFISEKKIRDMGYKVEMFKDKSKVRYPKVNRKGSK